MFYGVYNSHADTTRHSSGFINTWSVVRFKDKSERTEFMEAYAHKLARPVTRSEAEFVFRRNYTSVGKEIPVGGLFGESRWGEPNFDDWSFLKSAT